MKYNIPPGVDNNLIIANMLAAISNELYRLNENVERLANQAERGLPR